MENLKIVPFDSNLQKLLHNCSLIVATAFDTN